MIMTQNSSRYICMFVTNYVAFFTLLLVHGGIFSFSSGGAVFIADEERRVPHEVTVSLR